MDKAKENSIKYSHLDRQFWALEEPLIFTTQCNAFRLYKKANVLSVSLPDFTDRRTGQIRIGRTVTIQLDALIESPATLKALLGILCAARDKVDRDTWAALK